MSNASLSNNIRRLRFEKNEMTQQQLADVVGVTRQTIIAIEQGKYSPSLLLAFQIARAFGAPIESVFKFEPENPASFQNPLL
jgi:putative transcriptional regulator